MFWVFIGASAAVLSSLSFIPQIIKVLATKSAKDLSLVTLIQFSTGTSLWLAYGVHLKNAIIIIANAFTLINLLGLLLLYFLYRKN